MWTLAALQGGIISAPTNAVGPREGPGGTLPASVFPKRCGEVSRIMISW